MAGSEPANRARLPTLSRRALLAGFAGLAAAVGVARYVVTERQPPTELPSFIDVTSDAGITFQHRVHRHAHMIQAGAAFIDFNRNGLHDILLTNANGPNALYRNNGDGTFTDLAETVGIADPKDIDIGVACADYDNDGSCDILITRMGGLKLLHNEGDGKFTDVTESAGMGISGGHPASSVWADFDGDGHLDLYVTYWIDGSPPSMERYRHGGIKDAFTSQARSHRLFRNNGDGSFSEATDLLGDSPVHGAGLAVGFLDYDDDGRPDLYVVNDFGPFIRPNTLYRNAGPTGDSWRFVDISQQASVDAAISGMGLAVGDYDGDGWLDMFVTNLGQNVLYRNRAGETFEEMTGHAGVGRAAIQGKQSVGWGAAFLDFDNDGLLDLYFVAGSLYPEADAAGRYPPDQPNALFHNRGDGTFRDVSEATGAGHAGCARGLAVADFDGDGFLDLLVANYDQRPVLLRNSGNDKSWLQVRLVGTKSNRDGIGAKLSLKAGDLRQVREIQSGTSFLSQNSLTAHFGLGQAGLVDELNIRWPSGTVQMLTSISPNRTITVQEE